MCINIYTNARLRLGVKIYQTSKAIYCGWFVAPLRILQYLLFLKFLFEFSDSVLPGDVVHRNHSRIVAETLHSNAFLFVSHGAIAGHLYPIAASLSFCVSHLWWSKIKMLCVSSMHSKLVSLHHCICKHLPTKGGETWEGDSVHSGPAELCVWLHVYPRDWLLIDFT